MRATRRRGVLTAVVATAAVVAGLGWAAPASAVPAGLVTVAQSAAESSADKSAFASCPAGKVVTGGGGYLPAGSSAAGRVGLDRLEPLSNGTGFFVTMREVGPVNFAGDWGLQALAQCATAPAGYQVVAATGAVGTQYVTASCGTKKVIGMGGRINSGLGDVVLDQVVPSFDLASVTVRAVPVQGTSPAGWSATAVAVCATAPAGLERIARIGTSASDPSDSGLKACPAGKGLYSAGADINAGNGQVLLTAINITGGNTVRVRADEDADGLAGSWSLNGYGICGS
ncbi:hypothetical protein O7634_22015 [Micromonospora sp. WMMD1120]|uniref:hypothetical protein n=1 Tax=Micromonospora sp. WMMD1120 TaxID=3016106 RepID=UPI0024179DF3|nr:hypothetical protein [Micromonospora sp. WMMD1120]MDG4809432.1 hypothetical protein [Micromonospora sp. WMMD1120]